MRSRQMIETDGKRVDLLMLEVLLDIRELLAKKAVKPKTKSHTKKIAN